MCFIILGLLFVFFALYIARVIFKPGIGYFKTNSGKKEYEKFYSQIMAKIETPKQIYNLKTSFGQVCVCYWENPSANRLPPVLLLPGHSSGTPMWRDNLAWFKTYHNVYAIDFLGDAGRSVQDVPLKNIADVFLWIEEIMNRLHIEKVHLVGHSFGGGYAANFANQHSQRIASLSLLEPAIALNPLSLSVLFWAVISSLSFLPQSIRQTGLAKISGENISDITNSKDNLSKMIEAAAKHYVSALPSPKTLSRKELEKWTFPVYVAIADTSPITGKMAEKSAKFIPEVTCKVWKHTTHSLPMQVAEELAKELNTFWKRAETFI